MCEVCDPHGINYSWQCVCEKQSDSESARTPCSTASPVKRGLTAIICFGEKEIYSPTFFTDTGVADFKQECETLDAEWARLFTVCAGEGIAKFARGEGLILP